MFGQIPALTGVRFVAAVWVVLFHIHLFNDISLAAQHPALMTVVAPVVSQGDLGVDLFFLLSGFVLAHNYLDRLGPRPSRRDTMEFVWLRTARIWPLYMVAILGGGLLLWLRETLWGTEPNVPLTWGRLAEQVVMVQQWTHGRVPDSSWTGPAWSISAEWLAYLCFPLLAVAVWRLQRHAGDGATLVAACLVLLPILWWTGVTHSQSQPYMWLGRLASEFVCGMLLSAALSIGTPRVRRACTVLTPLVLVAILAWFYMVDAIGQHGLGSQALALFPVLVVCLAYGDGRVHRLLASRPLVLGGGLSFALYLVHVPLIKLFRDMRDNTDWVPMPYEDRVYGELVVALVSLVLAYLLFRYVEEPARRALRRRVAGPSQAQAPRPTVSARAD